MRVARRSVLALLGSTVLASRAIATDKFVTIGINLPLTGAAAEDAYSILHGAQLAIEEANARGGIGGYEIRQLVLDDATATAGQYDPAQAATNTRKMIADPSIVAAIGPRRPAAAARRWQRCSVRVISPRSRRVPPTRT
jgi:branched-chain amino acid transport system substrate-binding protein